MGAKVMSTQFLTAADVTAKAVTGYYSEVAIAEDIIREPVGMSCFTTGSAGKEHRTNKPPTGRVRERSK